MVINEQMMRPVMAIVTCIFYTINDVKDDQRLYTDGKMNLMTISIMLCNKNLVDT